MSKKRIKITKGLPASGKTTWAKQWAEEKPDDRVRVNRDDIRKMFGKYWVPRRERLVTAIENECILHALSKGFEVVVDATNLKGTQRFHDLFEREGFSEVEIEVVDHFLEVSLKTCIQRDQQREGDDHVGKETIIRMYNKYLNNE